MSEEQKKVKKLKAGVKTKTKPAVVPKYRKLKKRDADLPIELMPKKITKWNIVFSVIFIALLVITVINFYFYEYVIIPLPPLVLNILVPVILVIEVFLILLAFETYKVKFAPKLLRIILTVVTFIIFFPFTLFKYHTRHSVKRIVFTGLLLWSLIFSFFSPYFGLINKFRDLPPGQLDEQFVDPDWFESLFQGSAPFYIDGLLDLLDALDLNDTLGDQEMAQVQADAGSLGNYLYRWEINNRYDSTSWEFVEGNAQRFIIPSENIVPPSFPPSVTVTDLNVTQTVYTATTSILSNLLSTWSTYYTPHLYDVTTDGYTWDDFLKDENDTVRATPGTTNIRYNSRKQLSLQSTSDMFGFVGTYNYKTYFALDDDIPGIIDACETASDGNFGTTTFNNTYVSPLQIPQNYATISPLVNAYARTLFSEGQANGNDVYEQVTYILDRIIGDHGLPTADQTDNNGRDRAELLREGTDHSVSAYIALAIMVLRLNGIPARPVFGFAIGDPILGNPDHRSLTLDNLFAWVEALLPLNFGGGTEYHWGQFQIVPYPDNGDLIYCENTLYTAYNISIEMLSVPTQDVGLGQDVYVIDNYVDIDLRAHVSSSGTDVEGATVTFETITSADLQTYQSDPGQLLSIARDLGTAVTNAFGLAILTRSFDHVNYTQFNPSDPQGTSYVLFAYVSLASMNGTGFIVLPEGYLTSVAMNATIQALPDPPYPEGDYYIAQKGRVYQISTILYEDAGHTTPLVNRLVSYYILTDSELQDLLLGLIGPQDLTQLGQDFTDVNGNSTIYSYNTTTDTNHFAGLTDNTTYFIVASYGQNYTYAVMLYVDALGSTIDIDASDLANFDLDFYLYSYPFGGSEDPLENEPIEVWIAAEAKYNAYSGTDPDDLKTHLTSATYNSTPPYCQIKVSSALTDGNGFYNTTFPVTLGEFGVGIFIVIVFYLDTWNISETFTISSGPAFSINNIQNQEIMNPLNVIKETMIIFDNSSSIITFFMCSIGIIGLLRKEKEVFL